jgi:mutator protein MutT
MIQVVAGVLYNHAGQVLIAQRPAGKAFAGRWEFPGGKVIAGESPEAALHRELTEELGIRVERATPLLSVHHHYPGQGLDVRIEAWRVRAWAGEPASLEGQALRWCDPEALAQIDILEADRPIVTAIRVPRRIVYFRAIHDLGEHLARRQHRERVAWILASRPPRALTAQLAARRHAFFLAGPGHCPPGGMGSVLDAVPETPVARVGQALTGMRVSSGADAQSAAERGADFVLVTASALSEEDVALIVATGLPWYLPRTCAVPSPSPWPTGVLVWD